VYIYAALQWRAGILLCCCRLVCLSVHPVSIHFLRNWDEIWYIDLSWLWKIPIICSFCSFSLQRLHKLKWNLVYRLFWVQLSHFWQSYAPWTSKNSSNLQFLFIFFALVAHTEIKFCIQIYHIKEYLGQFLFWVRSSHFWQSYAPWTLKNSNYWQLQRLHILKWYLVRRFITI
jgi:hypothetical protein